jgi:hypothetical protein
MHTNRAAVLMYDLEKLPNLKELNIYKNISEPEEFVYLPDHVRYRWLG